MTRVYFGGNLRPINLGANLVGKFAHTELVQSGWARFDLLEFDSSGTTDFSNAKFAIFNQGKLISPVDPNGVHQISAAASSTLTIQNAVFDCGIWPGDSPSTSWTQIVGVADDEIYTASGFRTDVQPVPLMAHLYNEDGETEFVRYDLNVDGQFAADNIKQYLPEAVDYNYTILHDVNPNGPALIQVAIDTRGSRLRQVDGQTYDPSNDSTWEVVSSGDEDSENPLAIVGFRATYAPMMSQLVSMKSFIESEDDGNSINNDITNCIVQIWVDSNEERSVLLHSIVDNGTSVDVLFHPDFINQTLLNDNNTNRNFIFAFMGHPAFLENPSNPAGRKVFALAGCHIGDSQGTAYYRHIGTGGVASDLRLQCHEHAFQVDAGGGSTITFENCTFYGCSSEAVQADDGVNASDTIRFVDCNFVHNDVGVRSEVTWKGSAYLEGCLFNRHNGRSVELSSYDQQYNDSNPAPDEPTAQAVSPGNTVKRCTFLLNASSSPMTIANMGNNLIEECLFKDLKNSHGNALSMYRGSPAGSVIRNNLFINNARSLNLDAPTNHAGTYTAKWLGGCHIYNNLFYVNDDFGYPVPNASTMRILTYEYPEVGSYNTDARLIVYRNSFIVNQTGLLASNDADAYNFGLITDTGSPNAKRSYAANLFSDGGVAFSTTRSWGDSSSDGTNSDTCFSFDNAAKYGIDFPPTNYPAFSSEDYERFSKYWEEEDSIQAKDDEELVIPGCGIAWTKTGSALTEADVLEIATSSNFDDITFNILSISAETDASWEPDSSQLILSGNDIIDSRLAHAQTAAGAIVDGSNKWATSQDDYQFYGAFERALTLNFRYSFNLGPELLFADATEAQTYLDANPGTTFSVTFTNSSGIDSTYNCTTPTRVNNAIRWYGGDAVDFANIAPKTGSDGLQAGDSFTASIA